MDIDGISNKKSCCAVFVSYNPDRNFLNNVRQLIGQVSKILIVDNNSNIDSSILLNKLDEHPMVKIIYNESNLGIATALNQGLNYAIECKYEWLVTFDQDTPIPDDLINNLFDCYDNIPSKQNVAIVAPTYIIDLQACDPIDKNSYKFVRSTLTSGSLMKITAVKNIGLFDEDLFIDWVDHDYCMKARAATYKIVQSTHTFLIHSPGNLKQHKLLLNLTIHTSNHSTLRRYYMYRNRIICYRRYFVFDPIFVFYDFLVGLNELIKMILFEEKRISKILMVLIGIKDGILNKKGIYSK